MEIQKETLNKKPLSKEDNVEEKKEEKKEEQKEEFALTAQKLLVAGGHFGHKTRKWNPKMAKFIYTKKRSIHIINLKKTIKAFQNAYDFVKDLGANNKPIIFVGTKKQAKEIIKREAIRCNAMFVAERWLGGTLTNFKTIRKRFHRLSEIERMEENNIFSKLPKKEVILIKKEYNKLLNNLEGIRNMRGMPSAIFVIDPLIEIHAVKEAIKLNIPVVSVVDTNCDPSIITLPIPGNDDAVKSIDLFVTAIADAYNAGKGHKPKVAYTEDEEIEFNPQRRQNEKGFGNKNYKHKKHYKRDGETNAYGKDKGHYKKDFDKKYDDNYKKRKVNDQRDFDKKFVKKTEDKKDFDKRFVKKEDKQDFKKEDKKVEDKKNDNQNQVDLAKDLKKENKNSIKKELPKQDKEVAIKKDLDFAKMSLVELKKYAKENGIKNYSKLKKDELINFLKGEK